MFYTFDQNNPGGVSVYSEKRGVAKFVVIETTSSEEAYEQLIAIAENDYCHCCGHRWRDSIDEGSDPMLYGSLLVTDQRIVDMADKEDHAYIHYASGEIVRGAVATFLQEVMES